MKSKTKILLMQDFTKGFIQGVNVLIIIIMGLTLAAVFYSAGRWITHVAGAIFPGWVNITWMFLFLIYGCVLHDLIEPYIKSSNIQNEK